MNGNTLVVATCIWFVAVCIAGCSAEPQQPAATDQQQQQRQQQQQQVNPVLVADVGGARLAGAKDLYPGKSYSPYVKRKFPSQVYWGDTHLHTGLSLDAGLFGSVPH